MKKKKLILIFVSILFLILFSSLILFLLVKKEGPEKIERTELQLAHPELQIEDLVVGSGQKAEKGKKVTVHYIGKLQDGTIFDSTYDKERTFSFVLGEGRVIQGWEIGIEGMREGGKRKLIIPPELGYGESGVRGMIPSNTTIIFEVELLKVE